MPPDTAVRKRSNTPVEGLGRHLIGASGSLTRAHAGSRRAVAPDGNSAVIAKQIASMIAQPQRQACIRPSASGGIAPANPILALPALTTPPRTNPSGTVSPDGQ